MSIAILLIVVLFSNVYSLLFSIDKPKSPDTYGPYDINWKYYGACPLSEDNIGNVSMDMYNEKNITKGTLYLSFPATIRVDELKIVVCSFKNNKKSIIWNYKINKPCQHGFFAGALWQQSGARNCVVKKGNYNYSINFTDSINKFMGTSFFYGEYMFKGPYVFICKQIDVCPGVNIITQVQTTLAKEGNKYSGTMNITFPRTIRMDEIRLSLYNKRKNHKNLIYETFINNPCRHDTFASFVRTQLNSRNCVIKKGSYFCEHDFTESTSKLFGTSFFYGEYFMRITSLSKKQHILCMVFDIVFSKNT